MENSTIAKLLEDAERVALYGQRSGRLTDTKLAVAIQKAHQEQPELQWGSAAAVELQAALSEAIRVIEPVTLVDLHDWNPFDGCGQTSMRQANVTRVGFVTVAVLLMLLCGYYTIWYKTATQLLTRIAETALEQQDIIKDDTFFSMISNKDGISEIDRKNITSLINTAIRQKYRKIQDIEENNKKNTEAYSKVNIYLVPTTPAYYYVRSMFVQPPPGSPTEAYDCYPKRPQTEVQEYANRPSRPTASRAEMATNPFKLDAEDAPRMSELENLVSRGNRIIDSMKCIFGIQSAPQSQFQINVSTLKTTIEVVGLWVLPGLYGALGAMMYFMRWFLNQMRPNPEFGRVVLRVSLSTFAGIAVGWFWSPALSDNLAPNEITLGVLAIAFLVGFSIDVFFALLDRMVIIANSSIKRLGPA
jgi:hypothetical protein